MKSDLIFCQTDDTATLPLYTTTIGFWEHQIETMRPDGFPDYQLHQVLEGKGELVIHESRYIVGPGDVFFLFPGIPHSYTPISRQWKLAWTSFNGREASHMLLYAGIRESGPARLKDEQLLKPLEQLLTLSGDVEQEVNLERSKLLYALLLDLKLGLLTTSNLKSEIERMKPVLSYIEQNLHRTLALTDLAEVASVSPQYVCRLFQKTMGIRPMIYINQQRINQSKQLMFNQRDKKMYEIARMVGFDNASYFCSVFKRVAGMSPESFKRLHGLNS